MSLISCWIEKNYKQKVKIIKSLTTNSVYYTINNYTIRVSDHFSSRGVEENDLTIITPLNSKKLYLVMKKNILTPMSYTFHELKFIIDWEIQNNTANNKSENVKQSKEDYGDSLISDFNINDSKERTEDLYWARLVQYKLINDFPIWNSLSKGCKNAAKQLFADESNIPYSQCLEILKDCMSSYTTVEEFQKDVNNAREKYTYIEKLKNQIEDISKYPFKNPICIYNAIFSNKRTTNYWSVLLDMVYIDCEWVKNSSKEQKQDIKKIFSDSRNFPYNKCIELINKYKESNYNIIETLNAA